MGVLADFYQRIRAAKRTKKLDLTGFSLRSLPAVVLQLTSLEKLILASNDIRVVDAGVTSLRSLHTLSLRDNPELMKLPVGLHRLRHLKKLEIDNNSKLVEPPVEVVRKGIRPLLNYMRAIEEAVESESLELIDLGLVSLPSSVVALTSLTDLSLQSNRLEALPDTVGNLYNLKDLTLDYNRLRELPISLANLTALEVLSLNENKMRQFPEVVLYLSSLTSLYLEGNEIAFVPPSLGTVTALTELELLYNPLLNPPVDLLSSGTPAVMLYLNKLHQAEVSGDLDLTGQSKKSLFSMFYSFIFFPICFLGMRGICIMSSVPFRNV